MHAKSVAATLLTALLAWAGLTSAGWSRTKIVLAHSQQQLTPSFAIASSLPIALKFWEEEGLDVEVLTTPGASAAIQLLVAGRADVALANPTTTMLSIQRGAPIKLVYTATRGDIFGVGLPANTTIADLKGKTVGITSFASASNAYVRGLLRQAGLEPDKDVSIVEIGTGGRAAAAYQTKKVDAVSMWDEQYALLHELKVDFATIVKDPRAKSTITGALAVKTEDLEKRRAALVGLARGLAKAQAFLVKYPADTARIHWKVYPASAPRVVDDAAVASAVRVLETRLKIQSRDAYETGRFGEVPYERIADYQDYLVTTGELPKKVDVKQYLTNDLIAEVNAFDEAAVVAKAKKLAGEITK